jgi:hypothetical protein
MGKLSNAILVGLVGLAPIGSIAISPTPPVGATQPSLPTPSSRDLRQSCQLASSELGAGHVDQAVLTHLSALLTSPGSRACAIAGLTQLSAGTASVPGTRLEQRMCDQAQSLLAAGELDGAQQIYGTLMISSPGLSCAKSGLVALRDRRAAIDCVTGQKLLDAHQYDRAVSQFQAAIATAGSAPDARCGSDGLLEVQAAQDSIAPRTWNDWQTRILQWGLGILWLLGGLVLASFVVLMVAGWAVRLVNWVKPSSPRPRLVPRLRLSPLTGTVGQVKGDELTPLLRYETLTAQSKTEMSLQVVSGATNVQGLVAAVKDIDTKLGAWAQLAAAFGWLWPWQTLVVQGEVLPSGRDGVGITLSMGGGARVPSPVTFWRTPDSGTSVAAQSNQTVPQDLYDLMPAAGTWVVYEAARLSRTDSEYFSSAGAIGSGYLAASYRIMPADESGGLQLLDVALKADPLNASAQLSYLQRTPAEANQKCDSYLRVLTSRHGERGDSAWLTHPPDLSRGIWGVPDA